MNRFFDKLQAVSAHVRADEPMKKHTTFQIGGPADYYVVPEAAEELQRVLALCKAEQVPYVILGNGSNLLVSDKGYRGAVIHLGTGFCRVEADDCRIRAGAGATLAKTASKAWEEGLTGLEFAAGIPGTVGGAMVMNAGAYGGEMAQIVQTAVVLTKEGEIRVLTLPELEMGYRKSCILSKEYIVLEVELLLVPGDKEAIRARMNELSVKRKTKQPLEYPSAGSTFKRPEGYFAGKLIMDAGLRGFSVGGACVSEKHCGFVVNKGGATAADVLELCRQVAAVVKEKFGVDLEMEIKTLGDFS